MRGLRTTTSGIACPIDPGGAKVLVTDRDGSTAEYDANDPDSDCTRWSGPPARGRIAFATLKPFLDSLGCLTWHHLNGWKEQMAISPDSGCEHVMAPLADPLWVKLDVRDPATRHALAIERAKRPVTFHVLDETRTTEIAASAPSDSPRVELTFPRAGFYFLRIDGFFTKESPLNGHYVLTFTKA